MPAVPAITLPTDEVSALIPHRPPMQLLDAVLSCNKTSLVARVRLRPGDSFCGALGVPACIGLEYLGQAAAAFFCATTVQSATTQPSSLHSPAPRPSPGMLISSRSFSCTDGFFPVPADLLIHLAPASAMTDRGLVKFSGTITVLTAGALDDLGAPIRGAEPVFAQGDLSVYLPPA